MSTPPTPLSVPEELARKQKNSQAFNCPNCGAALHIVALGNTVDVTCRNCLALVDVLNHQFVLMTEEAKKSRRSKALAIGKRGVLQHIEWEVVGYVLKALKNYVDVEQGVWAWDEYLLYNPYHGYAFLVCTAGHWAIYRRVHQWVLGAEETSPAVYFKEQRYVRFAKDTCVVKHVEGEFYWRVKRNEEALVTDYICPPYGLSVESSASEVNTVWGEYIDAQQIAQAFNVPKIAKSEGVGALQPNPYAASTRPMVMIALFFCVLLCVIKLTLAPAPETLLQQNIAVGTASTKMGPIHLNKTGNLVVTSSANLNNQWIDTELTLTHLGRNQVHYGEQNLSYYSGYDDGFWHEGQPVARSVFTGLAAGDYELLISQQSDWNQSTTSSYAQANDTLNTATTAPLSYHVQVSRNWSSWRNWWLFVGLLWVFPVWTWLCAASFEKKRWLNSDFSSSGNVSHAADDDEDSELSSPWNWLLGIFIVGVLFINVFQWSWLFLGLVFAPLAVSMFAILHIWPTRLPLAKVAGVFSAVLCAWFAWQTVHGTSLINASSSNTHNSHHSSYRSHGGSHHK